MRRRGHIAKAGRPFARRPVGARLVRALAAASLALALLAPSASAQTLRGRILDSQTREPVMLAYVGLMADEGEMVVAALATTDGVFEVTAPDGGAYFLYVSRTGYETLVDGLFDIGDDATMDVQIGLKPLPIELDPVVVEAEVERSPLEVAGFYDRAITGQGTFLVREEIARKAVERITDAFREIPRIVIDEGRPLTGKHGGDAVPVRAAHAERPSLLTDVLSRPAHDRDRRGQRGAPRRLRDSGRGRSDRGLHEAERDPDRLRRAGELRRRPHVDEGALSPIRTGVASRAPALGRDQGARSKGLRQFDQ